ncbi:MAG: hypothetical protein KDJ65_33755 [Anaerolineae bacterium]|nr:hypothetical protein [Anaerolineae bacterium]
MSNNDKSKLIEEISHHRELLKTYTRHLKTLEIQAAKFGQLHVPSHLLIEIEDLRHKIHSSTVFIEEAKKSYLAQFQQELTQINDALFLIKENSTFLYILNKITVQITSKLVIASASRTLIPSLFLSGVSKKVFAKFKEHEVKLIEELNDEILKCLQSESVVLSLEVRKEFIEKEIHDIDNL